MSREVNGVMIPDDEVYAFPLHAKIANGSGGVVQVTAPGMLLRDWFAGQAIAGMLANGPLTTEMPKAYAASAYLIADAMMRAREGK